MHRLEGDKTNQILNKKSIKLKIELMSNKYKNP